MKTVAHTVDMTSQIPAKAPVAQAAKALSFQGVLAADQALSSALPPTPAWNYPLLDEVAGCRVLLKLENTQPTGAFKVRGGLSLVAGLAASVVGLVTASTGNHAQSIAYAARHRRMRATVVMPTSAPTNKIKATEALGATVVSYGETMTDALAYAKNLADDTGSYFVDPGGNPSIIHGHATVTLELLRAHPELQAIYVPVGSGTGAAGACLVRDELAPKCQIVAVQSRQAPAAHRAWLAGEAREAPCQTQSSGLATAASFELPQQVLRDRLDRFLLVDDADIDHARRLLATHAHTLAEGAGAAAMAGLLADEERPAFCAAIVSGGNADSRELADLRN